MTVTSEDPLYLHPLQPEALMNEDAPGFAEAKKHFSSGYEQQSRKQLNEAIASYKQATDGCPQMYEAFYNAGLCWEEQGQIEQALRAFEKAASINRTYKPIFKHLANLYTRLGDKMKAESNLAIFNQL